MAVAAFRTPGEILFGAGTSREAAAVCARFGRRVFWVTGARSLDGAGFAPPPGAVRWRVEGEPEVAAVDEGARLCREAACDVVLAVGGGSVLDAAKAAAVLATNGGAALDYLEEVGAGRAIERDPLPLVAVPTTAGSGSEATRNAVLRVAARGVKRSMRSDRMLPRVAIVDPELSARAPLPVAAAAGLDALTHLIEAYTSTGAQPTTDALALPGIRKAISGLRALASGRSEPEAMALASLWGGIALANAGLGAVHGLVAPLGGRCAIAHGAACAALLPETMRANLAALRVREPRSPVLRRYVDITVALGGGDAVEGLAALRAELGVPRLALRPEEIDGIVRDARGGSMKYNPVVLTDAELAGILHAAR